MFWYCWGEKTIIYIYTNADCHSSQREGNIKLSIMDNGNCPYQEILKNGTIVRPLGSLDSSRDHTTQQQVWNARHQQFLMWYEMVLKNVLPDPPSQLPQLSSPSAAVTCHHYIRHLSPPSPAAVTSAAAAWTVLATAGHIWNQSSM